MVISPLPQSFYEQGTQEVARALLGQIIVRRLPSGITVSGMIVETEAYAQDDPASHSFRGRTPRNHTMFGPAGRAYVYFTYGLHTMLNVVTAAEGVGEAVLIRAIEPMDGIGAMRDLRGGITETRRLTNGPGKLAQAFGLSRAADDGTDVTDPQSHLVFAAHNGGPFAVTETTRIGITQAREKLWRYYIKGNSFCFAAVIGFPPPGLSCLNAEAKNTVAQLVHCML